MGLFSFNATPKKVGKDDVKAKTAVKTRKDTAPKATTPRAKTPAKEVSETKAVSAPKSTAGAKAEFSAQVLRAPRITEKASVLAERGVYTFEITEKATKHDVMRAVKDLYKVTPTRVTIVRSPAKYVRLRNRRGVGMRSAVKKAYVYLKEGDKIEIA
jgi:large subunit ribosomal protein L23